MNGDALIAESIGQGDVRASLGGVLTGAEAPRSSEHTTQQVLVSRLAKRVPSLAVNGSVREQSGRSPRAPSAPPLAPPDARARGRHKHSRTRHSPRESGRGRGHAPHPIREHPAFAPQERGEMSPRPGLPLPREEEPALPDSGRSLPSPEARALPAPVHPRAVGAAKEGRRARCRHVPRAVRLHWPWRRWRAPHPKDPGRRAT